MLAHSQTRFRKIRIIWNCTFFVVLVFAKFPIKSIQHASKSFPHPLLFKSSFLKYFCTYVTSFSVCASVLGIFSMEVLRTLHNFYSTGRCQKSYNGDNYKISERTRFQYWSEQSRTSSVGLFRSMWMYYHWNVMNLFCFLEEVCQDQMLKP